MNISVDGRVLSMTTARAIHDAYIREITRCHVAARPQVALCGGPARCHSCAAVLRVQNAC